MHGGQAVNQAIAAKRLDPAAHVVVVGQVGSDEKGQSILAFLKENDIDTSAVEVTENFSTGQSITVAAKNGRFKIEITGATQECKPDAGCEFGDWLEQIDSTDVLMLNSDMDEG